MDEPEFPADNESPECSPKPEFIAKPTERFSSRVEAYRRFRSRYPRDISAVLEERCGLTHESVVADVGAGTGMLAEVFLENGNRVFAVEPNADMRAVCEELEERYPQLTCVDGIAEGTGLGDHSVDFVAVGRALHWFDQEKCRPEFVRILRAGGWVVLASHGPHTRTEPSIKEFQKILREHGTDYGPLRRRYDIESAAKQFFGDNEIHEVQFPDTEEMTYDQLEGYALSLSVIPQPGHPGFPAMQRALQEYFARHESGGRVQMPMTCKLHFGHLQ